MSASVLIQVVEAEGFGGGGIAAYGRLEETGVLRRTITAGPTGSRSSPLALTRARCAERSDGL